MHILIIGAGPLGSLFAVRLHEAGHHVALLARGSRLAELREHSVILKNAQTDQIEAAQVEVVASLEPEDAYDLVLVIMRKNCIPELLPLLAANQHTPNIVFLGNNAAGPAEYIQVLGAERVLFGFPMAGGVREGHVMRVLAGTSEQPSTIPLGEADGHLTGRVEWVAQVLASMRGFQVEIRADMDAWLKSHVALLMPSIAPALYAAGLDRQRLARTRDLIVLAVRAIREGFSVLRALGIPVVPARFRRMALIPEPLLVAFLEKLLQRPELETALVGHASAGRDEVRYLADEFRQLARQSGVSTPSSDRLYPYLDPQTPLFPDGRAVIPMDWRGVWGLGLGAAGLLLALGLGVRALVRKCCPD